MGRNKGGKVAQIRNFMKGKEKIPTATLVKELQEKYNIKKSTAETYIYMCSTPERKELMKERKKKIENRRNRMIAFIKENIGKKDIDKLTSEKFHISIAAAAQFRVKHGFKKNPKKIEGSLREQLEEIERRELKFMEKEREPKHNYFTFDTKNLFK